jgi:hypothetical protein
MIAFTLEVLVALDRILKTSCLSQTCLLHIYIYVYIIDFCK